MKLFYADRECLSAVYWDICAWLIAPRAVDNRSESQAPLSSTWTASLLFVALECERNILQKLQLQNKGWNSFTSRLSDTWQMTGSLSCQPEFVISDVTCFVQCSIHSLLSHISWGFQGHEGSLQHDVKHVSLSLFFHSGMTLSGSGIWANHEDLDEHTHGKTNKKRKARKWTLQNPTTTEKLWAFRSFFSFTGLHPCIRLSYQYWVRPTIPPKGMDLTIKQVDIRWVMNMPGANICLTEFSSTS